MVDFNNENTISTPLREVLKILILECRYNVLLKIRDHYQHVEQFKKPKFAPVKAGVMELYQYLRSMYAVSETLDKAEDMKRRLYEAGNFEEMLVIFQEMEDFLYKKNITKIDDRKQYDTTSLETENHQKGL